MKIYLLIFLPVFITTVSNGSILKRQKPAKHHSTYIIQDISRDRIPVIAWIGVTEHGQSDRYQELKAAGFTDSYWPFQSANAVEAAMREAQKVGIRVFVSCPEFASQPEVVAKRFMNNPGNAGYFINDEPTTSRFAGLASLIKRIKTVDNNHVCYVNLLPNIATASQLGANNYNEYITSYLDRVPSDILSFDHYPIVGSTSLSITREWYQNLELISRVAKKYNKPFWAFALSVAFAPHPVATLGSLRLQVFSDLAYGAQAIQYFTYWTPVATTGGPNFHHAVIGLDGKQTNVYEIVRQVNTEIKNLSGVFLGAKMISVTHTGSSIPIGTTAFTSLPAHIASLKTSGLGAVISILQNKGKTYLVIVNRDFNNAMKLTIKCNSGVSKVANDGSSARQNMDENIVSIEPGDIAIYSWQSPSN